MTISVPDARSEIFHGLVGDVVDVFKPYTEAAAIAIASQYLIAFGNAVGRQPRFDVGETRHYSNENLLLVGTSSRSRKGDSSNVALRPIIDADSAWASNIASGLSSGEGLIFAVRDEVWKKGSDGGDVLVDQGAEDKRLLVLESEFSTALKQFSRQGNTLSNIIRTAWDCKTVLRTLTKHSPLRATNPHISIIAHTTPEDLHAHLTDVDVANGLGNRFIFILVHREQELPTPGRAPQEAVEALTAKVQRALAFARGVEGMRRSPAAEEVWSGVYHNLTREQPGLGGKLLSRSEGHVLRLSKLYALSARSNTIETDHQEAALALWDYAEASVGLIFGRRTGRHGADRIAAEMLPGQTLNHTDIRSQIFNNHVSAVSMGEDIDLLEQLGVVRTERRETGGRPELLVTRLEPDAQKREERTRAKSSISAKSPSPGPVAAGEPA